MTVGERIKSRRKEIGMSVDELAEILNKNRATVYRYESDDIENLPITIVIPLAKALRTTPEYILGWDRKITELDKKVLAMYPEFVPGKNYLSDLIPVSKVAEKALPVLGFVPVVDGIAAGLPVLAEDNIIDYMPVTVRNPNEYFALVVRGESMIGAGIPDGCKVLIHMQSEAEDGQIVACRVNGDEATLKRFKQKGDTVFLMPENPNFDPYIVPAEDFYTGEAEIIGIVRQIIIDV